MPDETTLKDAVIEAARKLEQARSAPSDTFDMREFWYAVKDVSEAVAALNAQEALNA